MFYYLIVAALVAHAVFWGAGLAWLALPPGWRRWWWMLAPGFGVALQSAVVWAGAHAGWPGTDSYAWASELVPLALLGVAAWRAGWRELRQTRVDPSVIGLVILAGWWLTSPLASSGHGLTSTSLGSCDPADYAAGARVFQEFSSADRTGFLGQTEVTRVGSAETFFDFWLRLNHFTPSALLAHNGTILDCRPHELVSATGVSLVLLNLPVVLWLARVALGFRRWGLMAVVALYAFSPLTAYAVDHGALGQLYAAQGIALLTLAVLGAGRSRRLGYGEWRFGPLVLAAFWLLAGSYNFILTVALAPAAAGLLGDLWLGRDARKLGRIAAMIAAAGAVCAGLFPGRFDGLVERFQLFGQYNFGWPVPLLGPEGWLGLVRSTALEAWPLPGRLGLGLLVAGLGLAGFWALWRRQRVRGFTVLALVLPVAAGWSVLAWETTTRANAGYDAFKLVSVFAPELLVGLLAWVVAARAGPRRIRIAAGFLLAGLVLANAFVAQEFRRSMAAAPLRVDRSLLDLRQVEGNPRVGSINLRVEDFWARLWANALLLRKPQYFLTHTYEGRLNTPLRGDWDLSDSLLRAEPLSPADYIAVNGRFHLARVGAPGRIAAEFGDGWYPLEGEGINRWRWSAGDAGIRLLNPAAAPTRVVVVVRVAAVAPRALQLRLGGALLGEREIDRQIQTVDFGEIAVPPGESVLTLRSTAAPERPGPGDARVLSVALYDLTLRARP